MEIGKEKVVIVPVSTLGLLLAVAMGAEWKTENTKEVAAAILDGNPGTKNELLAYMVAFNALEVEARGCGEIAERLIDGAQETYGAEVLEKVLHKIEEIGTIRNRRDKR